MVKKAYRLPLLLAVVLHLMLLVLFMIKTNTNQYRWQQSTAGTPKIVNATTIDAKVLAEQMDKIKSEQVAKQRQEAEHLRQLAQKTRAYKQQRLAEQRRLKALQLKQKELQKQQLAQAQALRHQQQEEQVAKQKALQWQKKAAEAKKHELAKQQETLQQHLLAQQIKDEQQRINSVKQQQQENQEQAAQLQGQLDKYRAQILQAIESNWHPLVQDSSLSCQMLVRLAPGGMVMGVELVKSSGDATLDRSARLAILKASPLPVPQDQALFERFREFRIKMSPQDIKGMG